MKTILSDNILSLKRAAKELGMTYDELSSKAGIPVATIKNIFSGKTKSPRIDTIRALEKALGIKAISSEQRNSDLMSSKSVKLDGLLGLDELDLYPIPLLGEVVAGIPIEAQQNLEGYIYISYRPKEEYFALRVHGDSMRDAGIVDRAIIICHKQETAENGEIVVAMVNGEQTIKRYKVHGNNIFLMPANSDFMPIPITPMDEFKILGKVVELRVSM